MRPKRKTIATPASPATIGPCSQAILIDGLLYCSGQIPLDPSSGELSSGDVAEQTRRCLENLDAICVAADTELLRAVKVTIYLRHISDSVAVDDVYADFFPVDPPARVLIAVAGISKDALVEIDAVVAGKRRFPRDPGRLLASIRAQAREAFRTPRPFHC